MHSIAPYVRARSSSRGASRLSPSVDHERGPDRRRAVRVRAGRACWTGSSGWTATGLSPVVRPKGARHATPGGERRSGREEVLAPVVREVAPDRVDVVRAVLGVVVLDEEPRPADRVIVAPAGRLRPGPGERDARRGPASTIRSHSAVGDLRPRPLEVVPHEPLERRARRAASRSRVADADRDRPRRRPAGPLPLRMSGGATGRPRSPRGAASGVSAASRRARQLLLAGQGPGAGRRPARDRRAGFAPRNDGALPITRPPASVSWIATWWPPTRHDHGPVRARLAEDREPVQLRVAPAASRIGRPRARARRGPSRGR